MLYFLKNKIFLNQQLSLALRDYLWPWVWGGPGHRPAPPHHTHINTHTHTVEGACGPAGWSHTHRHRHRHTDTDTDTQTHTHPHTHTVEGACGPAGWSPSPPGCRYVEELCPCAHVQASLSAHWPPLEYLGYFSCPKGPRFLVPGTLGESPLGLGFSSSQNFIFCL